MHFRHDWVEVGRVFNSARPLKARNVSEDLVEEIGYGFTRVEYACRREGCEKRKVVRYTGRLPEPDAGGERES